MIGAGEDNTVRILSIDGGGIRGILPARVLQYIEERIANRPITDLFHMIAGTSTGGIIGCGLLAGKTGKQLGDLYAARGGDIFDQSLWRTVTTIDNLAGAKYAADTLEEILLQQLGDTWLGDTGGPELLVPSYVIELPRPVDDHGVPSTRQPFLFKTWKARGSCLDADDVPEALDFRLRDIARATSAAPTYFPPAHIQNRRGDWFGAVDGGVFANNPAMCALTSAHKIYPDLRQRPVILVSLGTGTLERPIPYAEARGWGELRWLHPVLSLLLDGNSDTVCYEADQMLGDRHFRIETSTGTDLSLPYTAYEDFDNAAPDNIARLERLAQHMIDTNRQKLERIVTLLTPEKCELPLSPSAAAIV